MSNQIQIKRSVANAVVTGLANGELVAFTAHFFDDHRQMQHAATRDTVGAVFLFGNLQRHVGNGFTFQAFRQMV